jgi:hypothetical protein
MIILLILFGSIALVAVITVATMRFLARKFGVTDLANNGIRMTKDGIEYLGFLFCIRRSAFNEIQSVELVPYYKVFVSTLLFRYGLYVGKVPPNFSGKIVVVRLKRANPLEYLFFTPKDAANFVEQLKQRINEM